MRVNYAIIFVSDMKRSVAFYRDIIGAPLKFESPGWTEFATEGATLALRQGNAPPQDTAVQGAERAGQCRTGFQVADLEVHHRCELSVAVAHCVSLSPRPPRFRRTSCRSTVVKL